MIDNMIYATHTQHTHTHTDTHLLFVTSFVDGTRGSDTLEVGEILLCVCVCVCVCVCGESMCYA